MKNKQFSKIALLALSLVLMIGAIFALTANAATTPEIKNMNVQYTDKFCLVYAVPADTVQGGSATLYLYDADPATGAEPIRDYNLTKTTPAGKEEVGGVGLDYEAYVFYTDGVAAMSLDQVFYAQVVDANNNKSDVKSYSVVEYLYTRLADVDGKANTIEQNELYEAVITFGTAAQKKFLKADVLANTTLISEYCYVSAASGYTVEGKSAGVFPQNKPLTVAKSGESVTGYTLTTYTSYDISEGETEQTMSGSTLVVSNSYRAHVSAGAIVRTYRDNVINFEDATIGKTPSIFDTTATFSMDRSSTFKKLITAYEDTVFGEESKVIKYAFTDTGKLKINPVHGLTGDEIADADALELSFDMKVDASTADDSFKDDGEGYSFAVMLYSSTVSGDNNRLYVRFTVLANGQLKMVVNDKSEMVVPVTVMANEYNSFRFVVTYDSETNKNSIDIYVNNFSTTPDASYVSTNTPFEISTAALFGIGNHKNTTVGYELNHYGATYYFDNMWCGFTKK